MLAAFRKVCWRARPMSEEHLLRRVARHLGVRVDRASRPLLARHLATALARRIVAREEGRLRGATPTFGSYGYDFLIGVLRLVMRDGLERERAELTREVALHLGYRQVTAAMRDRMEEVFRTGVLTGLLGARGSRVWRLG